MLPQANLEKYNNYIRHIITCSLAISIHCFASNMWLYAFCFSSSASANSPLKRTTFFVVVGEIQLSVET